MRREIAGGEEQEEKRGETIGRKENRGSKGHKKRKDGKKERGNTVAYHLQCLNQMSSRMFMWSYSLSVCLFLPLSLSFSISSCPLQLLLIRLNARRPQEHIKHTDMGVSFPLSLPRSSLSLLSLSLSPSFPLSHTHTHTQIERSPSSWKGLIPCRMKTLNHWMEIKVSHND